MKLGPLATEPIRVQVEIDSSVFREASARLRLPRVPTWGFLVILVLGYFGGIIAKANPLFAGAHVLGDLGDLIMYLSSVFLFTRCTRLESELRSRMVLDAMTRNEFTWGSKPIPSKPPPPPAPPLPLLHTLRTEPLRGCACAQCQGLRKMRGI